MDISIDEIASLNFARVSELWSFIDTNTEEIAAACDADQRKRFYSLRDAARDAFFKAAANKLADNGPAIAELRKDLEDATKSMKAELKTLQSVESFLKAATKAARFAGALVTFASAA